MPTPEARAAFDEAQRIAAEMRDIHVQELAVENVKRSSVDHRTIVALDQELVRLRSEWTYLSGEYTKAIGRFTAAVEKSRGSG